MCGFNVGIDGGTLIVEGPADVSVVSGQCEVLGCPVSGSLHVEEFRALPITGKCVLSIRGGVVRYVDGSTIPSEWSNLSLEGIVLVIGDVDSGKTTLSTYLLNRHVARGLHVCVIDADVGQSSIGPPGVIGGGCTSFPTYSLSEIHMLSGYFVGCTSPSQCVGRFIAGLSHVIRDVMSRTPGLVIIDMPGWVSDGGLEFIRSVIDSVAADYVVSLDLDISTWSYTRIIRVPKSPYVRSRDSDERRALRINALRHYLGGELKNVEVGIDRVFGNSVIECIVRNCGRYVAEEGLSDITKHSGVVKVPMHYLNNVFAGLIRRGFLVGFGIIKRFDIRRGVAELLATTDTFDYVTIGRMRVDPESLEELKPIPFI
ncbi:MAG: Clp1/GlmU family protein [Vulcanisaeta sp.]